MQKYPCPRCKARLKIQRTFERKILISCPGCALEDVVAHSKNIDEAVLDFACRYDGGEIADGPGRKMDGILRDEGQIREMVGKDRIDEMTRGVLYTKKDYVSYYTKIRRPAPEMGAEISESGLDEGITCRLKEMGIGRLYRFQEEAIGEIICGNDVVIEAPTASGKTEAFLIPVMQRIRGAKAGKVLALFVYPTKSLARDQFPKIDAFAKSIGARAAVFDGDTGRAEREKILDDPPQVMITNFDVIHYHLMYGTRLASLLDRLRFLVADETHVYSGIFGSNIYYVIKRLRRIAGTVQFVAASATLDNAKKFCEKLFDTEMTLISGSGSRGETDFVMLFPSLRTQRDLMADLAGRLTARKHRTMVFSNSHLNSELLAIQARRQKVNIKVHRGGLMANYRRSVERAFREGALDAISCTPTLELGIDIGGVDGVISSAIPVNRLMQRIGRAARKGQHGYAFLALGNDPISQYYKNHPGDYFEDVERSYIDPRNPFVEEFHVLAMACDRPISKHELTEHAGTIARHLKEGNLVLSGGRYAPNHEKISRALKEYSIRGIGGSVDIFLDGRKAGDRVLPIALEELHRDAIYFLAGTRYRVREFGYPEKGHAVLERIPRDYPYRTKALSEEWPTIEKIYEQRTVFGMEVAFCKLHIQKSVYGYVNIELGQEAMQGERVQLDRPLEYDFVTKGIVFHAPGPSDLMAKSSDGEYVEASSYHAAEHVIIEGSNMITGGVSQDLGGISLGTSGMIFVYDGAIGGNGASRALYDRLEKALERSASIVRECPCIGESGCPRCTFSYRCGNNNEFLHKLAALEVFERILGGERTNLEEPSPGDRPLV